MRAVRRYGFFWKFRVGIKVRRLEWKGVKRGVVIEKVGVREIRNGLVVFKVLEFIKKEKRRSKFFLFDVRYKVVKMRKWINFFGCLINFDFMRCLIENVVERVGDL